MYLRYIRNEIKNNRLLSVAMIVIMTVAALLLSISLLLTGSLFGSIDTMMENAKAPHFMQMHAGNIDKVHLQSFVETDAAAYVQDMQIAEFLNIDGANFCINGITMEDSVQDLGLCIANERFDLLPDLDGITVSPVRGEIYLPVVMKKENTAANGDLVTICGRQFIVKGFFRDSLMNSMLASSKRFLVNAEDYQELRSFGTPEYLIEFRLNDLDELHTFEQLYTKAGLEANGPTLTYPLFRMLNAISDGILIAVILLVSVLVTIVALLCIRFTLLAKLEEELREIGVMKGIGISMFTIKLLYLSKDAAIAAAGCAFGYALSQCMSNFLLAGIRLYMGENRNPAAKYLLPLIGVCLLFLITVLYLYFVLRRISRVSAKEAINQEISLEKVSGLKMFPSMHIGKWVGASAFLGIRDVLSRKKLYLTSCFILMFLVFIMLVPFNLFNTISDSSFVTYMGVGMYDFQMDLQQTEDAENMLTQIEESLLKDENVKEYAVFSTKVFTIQKEDDTLENLKVDIGDHGKFPVYYFEGHAPKSNQDIALSASNAEDLQKNVGDFLQLTVEGHQEQLVVCGIYSDIMNGGKTAKACFPCEQTKSMRYMTAVQLKDPTQCESETAYYAELYPSAKVSDVKTYIAQTFGQTRDAIKTAAIAAIAAALIIAVMVVLLFVRMLIAKDRMLLKTLHYIGFSNSEMQWQYVVRMLCVLAVGLIGGVVFAGTCGEWLAGALMSSFGIRQFRLLVNPLLSYGLLPLLLCISVTAAAGSAGRKCVTG